MSKVLENMGSDELPTINEELRTINKGQKSKLEPHEAKLSQMQFQLDQMKRLLFGAKRERFAPGARDENQVTLPFDVKPEEEPEKQQETITYVRSKTKRENHPGRLPLPDHLPVGEIVVEPKGDTTGMKCIGKETTGQLELVPAKLFIKRYIRPKYIKPRDKGALTHKGVMAELPAFPIEKGIAGPGLLAQAMIDKFVGHLPIYRQIERFKREGIKIPSSTVNGWQEAVCNLLEPLYGTLEHRALSQGYLQVDETPIQVLDKTKKGKTHRGYHWVYYSPLEKTVLFDYRNGRSREGPDELLKNFSGYLQTDGYKVYGSFGQANSITSLNCMAHARRGFEKALGHDKARAEYAMGMFRE